MDLLRIDIVAVLRGLLTSFIYAALFVGLWHLSFDQWYLPAGIRAASLLLLRYRLWPYVFIGDAAAVMYLRIPQATNDEQVIGAIVASILLLPLISIIPFISRLFIPKFSKAGLWQPVIFAAMAIWTALWMQTINAFTMPQPVTLEIFLRWAAGYYLGMLVIVPPILVYDRAREAEPVVSNFVRDVGLAGVIVLGLFLGLMAAPNMENSLRVVLLLVLITPAMALSAVHGWRGAAIGVTMTNVAIGLSIPDLSKLGDHNTTTFNAQLVLAFFATILIISGELFSRHFEALRRLGIAEEKAKRIARLGIIDTEQQMRDRVMFLMQCQNQIEEAQAQLVARLRAEGNHSAAEEVIRAWVMQPQFFEAHNSALYPVSILSEGLYHALQSSSFPVIVAGGSEVRFRLKGQPKLLSTDAQLTAYRTISSAIGVLSAAHPAGYRVHARVWIAKRSRGIYLCIEAVGGGRLNATMASSMSEIDIDNRVQTRNGASWRRRGHQISVLLPDTDTLEAYRSFGPINQASPFGV
ncbi:MASE1 domain-containing protein [Lysobacter brunescens]|uniref:MASE1 domain-containing protein n=1 Tax=Lysobacter brunescens TaxID=262323 RepID=A0ABW2YKD8_9GAMM